MDTPRTTPGTTADRRWFGSGRSRTVAAVVVTILICGAATAGAAALITGADVKNGSLTGEDIKKGSIPKGDLEKGVQNALAIRVTGGLPTKGFKCERIQRREHGRRREVRPVYGRRRGRRFDLHDSLNGQPFSDVKHLAFEARYTADNNTGGVGVPYLRVFLNSNDDDAIFSPNTQSPDPDTQQGPFHTWVATAGSWRYDDDPGNGPDSPFATIQSAHASEKISKICISVGNTAGNEPERAPAHMGGEHEGLLVRSVRSRASIGAGSWRTLAPRRRPSTAGAPPDQGELKRSLSFGPGSGSEASSLAAASTTASAASAALSAVTARSFVTPAATCTIPPRMRKPPRTALRTASLT